MYSAFTGYCARSFHCAAALGLALVGLSLVNPSISGATPLANGSYSIEIQVIDHAGPVEVSDQYTGIASNGLPTIEIYETFYQPGNEPRFWSDVELRVTLCPDDNGSDNPIISMFDDIHNMFDDITNLFNFGNQENGNGSEGSEPWQGGLVIGIDKFVRNHTDRDWDHFRIELGTGLGNQFVPSDGLDSLYVVDDPMTKETTAYYNDPPQRDLPNSDYLQWTADGETRFGQSYDDRAGFWFGVNIPEEMFELDPHGGGYLTARFTLRQHTGMVPEPSTLLLLSAGTMFSLLRRKQRLR
jgi:hypothetical protein